MNLDQLTSLFCMVDDFCKVFVKWEKAHLIPKAGQRSRPSRMSLSELLTIVIALHLSPYKHFKAYYEYGIGQRYRGCFADLLSYNRFVQLMPRLFLPLSLLRHLLQGQKSGIYYVDSTRLEVCHLKRTGSHKVFRGLAQMGKSTYGWFMGFKLHLVINDKGQMVAARVTAGNRDDRKVVARMVERADRHDLCR